MKKFRVTIEFLNPEDGNTEDSRTALFMFDHGRIAGDVWINQNTTRHSFDVDSSEFCLSVGWDANNVRSVNDYVARERARHK